MWWWPGFSEAWQGRSRVAWWIALGWSVAAGAAVRGSVAGAPGWALVSGWALVVSSSLVNGWRIRNGLRKNDSQACESEQDLFLLARSEYLKGEWFEAYQALERLLRRQPRHFSGLLLQATLLRRMERWDDAEARLCELEVLPQADEWRLEIDRERQAVINGRRLSEVNEAA